MGTNYYWQPPPGNLCIHCGRSDNQSESIHIGKSSAGWCFALHVTDEIRTLGDWVLKFALVDSYIYDEYGTRIEPAQMVNIITKRGVDNPDWSKPPQGFTNWESFHNINFSEFGPRGLLRAKVMKVNRCVGHGMGTWDYFDGEFS